MPNRIFTALLLCIAMLAGKTKAETASYNFELPFLERNSDGSRVFNHRYFNVHVGPKDGRRLFTGTRLVPTTVEGLFLGLDGNTLLRVRETNGVLASVEEETSSAVDLWDWPMDITYDSAHHRNVLVSLSGKGAFYARSSEGVWSQFASADNYDFESMVYHRGRNEFWGLEVYNGSPSVPARMLVFSSGGVKMNEVSLPAIPIMVRPGENTSQMVGLESAVILLVERDPRQEMGPEDKSRIYVINTSNNTTDLTFEKRPGGAPTVRFISPTNHPTIQLGQNVEIVLEVADKEGDLNMVELYDAIGTAPLIKTWNFDSLGGTQRLTHVWATHTVGDRNLIAQAYDKAGHAVSATPVRVNVQAQKPLYFAGRYWNGSEFVWGEYNESGPTEGEVLFRGIPVVQAGRYYYGKQTQEILKINAEYDTVQTTSPGPGLPELSWPRGTAFDAKRNRIVVVSLGGDGFLYAINPTSGEWSLVRSMNNVDVDSIVYHPADDSLYMVQNSGGNSLKVLRYSPEGEERDGSILIQDVPFQVGHYYQSRLISDGRGAIALLIEPLSFLSQTPPIESRMYILDTASKTVALAYRKVWDQWPPQPQPDYSAVRTLPEMYAAGVPFRVSIATSLSRGINSWGVEETPPAGWSVSEVSHAGTFDGATGKVKWGPFNDFQARTLTYTVKPPVDALGPKTFTGKISANGRSKGIVGPGMIAHGNVHHPADIDPRDFVITLNEVTAYSAAWSEGRGWSNGPSPIPMSYVTRAGFLWRSGEHYRFVTRENAPDCWAPLEEPIEALSMTSWTVPSVTTRWLPPAFTPGRPVEVKVQVRPNRPVAAFAVEEEAPAGWQIVNGQGSLVPGNRIRFGPFFDGSERTLQYTVIPPGTAVKGEFRGDASFDGKDLSIVGERAFRLTHADLQARSENRVGLRIHATPGERFQVETANSIDASEWKSVSVIEGAENPVDLPEVDAGEGQRFYRLRPVTP